MFKRTIGGRDRRYALRCRSNQLTRALRDHVPKRLQSALTFAALRGAPDVRTLFSQAVTAAITSKDPDVSNSVCWMGSVDGFADIGLQLETGPSNSLTRIKRAFTATPADYRELKHGNKQEAIEDFRAFIAWSENQNLAL